MNKDLIMTLAQPSGGFWYNVMGMTFFHLKKKKKKQDNLGLAARSHKNEFMK